MEKYLRNYLENRVGQREFYLPKMIPSCTVSIVIPCYKEAELLNCLKSLETSGFSKEEYEVIVVVNRMKESNEVEIQLFDLALKNCEIANNVHGLEVVFDSKKKSGVGEARKIGMDLALKRFIENDELNGLIVCLDADCTVEENYLNVLSQYQKERIKSPCVSINYEHIIKDKDNQIAIYQYELHLRYYVEMQRKVGLPYAFHTVGSSMAVRAWAYAKEGGMNRRKAGEDFYFIHKYTGDENFEEINSTTVYPSSRSSDRVPFGTGRAILNFQEEIESYSPLSFKVIEEVNDKLKDLYRIEIVTLLELESIELPSVFISFIKDTNKLAELQTIKNSIKDYSGYRKRYFQWFDAFLLMKFLHYCRDLYFPNEPVLKVAHEEAVALAWDEKTDLLEFYRANNKKDQWRQGVIS